MMDFVSDPSVCVLSCGFDLLLWLLTLGRLCQHLVGPYLHWLLVVVGSLFSLRVLTRGYWVFYKVLGLQLWGLVLAAGRLPSASLSCLRVGNLWLFHDRLSALGLWNMLKRNFLRQIVAAREFKKEGQHEAEGRRSKKRIFHRRCQLLWEKFLGLQHVSQLTLLVELNMLATCSLAS